MKQILVKQALVVDSSSPYNGRTMDILIEDGVITDISKKLDASKDATQVAGNNLHVSAGWFDMRANFWDPGHEHKEDLHSGVEAAAYGGFTGLALMPETEPVLATKSQLEYVRARTAAEVVEVLPVAYLGKDKEFTELSEMYDLVAAGAIAFSSGYRPVADSSFLLRALLYAKELQKTVILYPENKSMANKGQMNEGVMSVQLGLKGVPALAEEMEVANLISICEYTGAAIHLSPVTTARAIELIRNARAKGLPITASVSTHHLYFSEEDLSGFNTNLKLRPSLRTMADRDYLRKAVLSEDFIAVASDHTPHEDDRKKCEFELAAFGASGIQSCFSQLLSVYGTENLSLIVEALTTRPRRMLGLEVNTIDKGKAANLTLFDPTMEWELNEGTNRSKSRNSPLWKTKLQGKAVGIINKGRLKLLD